MMNYTSNNFIMFEFMVKKVYVETPLLNASKEVSIDCKREN